MASLAVPLPADPPHRGAPAEPHLHYARGLTRTAPGPGLTAPP